MGDVTPIVEGALYRDVSCDESHGSKIRVKSVWVDENLQTQVQVFTEEGTITNGRQNNTAVDLESFVDRIDDTLIRINSDHEAWEYRN